MGEMTDFSGELVDVSGVSLRELDHVDPSRLAQALRQVLEEADSGPVAGFGSRI